MMRQRNPMRSTLTAALVFSASIGTAHAQGMDKQIAACAAQAGDLKRLECYDQLAHRHKLDAPQPNATPASGIGKWRVHDARNPIDDSRTVTLSLTADSGRSKWDKPILLILRCMSNKTDMYIKWHDYLGSETYVTSRIGDKKANTREWTLSTDNQSAFHPGSPIATIKTLLDHPNYVAQATPYSENPITATFDVRGLTNAIRPLRETCNW